MFLSRKRNKRSNVPLSHVSPTTLAPGNIVPVSYVRIVDGDRLSFEPSAFVQAFPMSAPLVNGFKICFEYFFCPDRLYNVNMLLDKRDTTADPFSVKYPQITLPTDIQSGDFTIDGESDDPMMYGRHIVQPHSLADYCGYPVGYLPVGYDDETKYKNGLKVAAYLDIINTYYVNQNVDKIPTAYWERNPSKTGGQANVVFDTAELEDFVQQIKLRPGGPIRTAVNPSTPAITQLGTWDWMCSRASIFQRSFPDYYLEAWLKTSGYEDAAVSVDLEADGNSISMRNISMYSHIQRWMDLAFGGGARYSDYMNSQFDTTSIKHTSSPLWLGSDRQYLGSNVIYQTTGFESKTSPLGSFAGQSAGGEKFRRRSFKFGEPGYFVVMASLVPDVIYTRGIDVFNNELTLGDSYVPAMDNISMQPLMTEELNLQGDVVFLDTDDTTSLKVRNYGHDARKNIAIGYVPAWSQYRHRVSRAHGRLCSSLNHWLLDRRYGLPVAPPSEDTFFQAMRDTGVSEDVIEAWRSFIDNAVPTNNYAPYVRANAYNDVFADTDPDAQNFVLTFTANMSVNREIGKVNVPNTL